MAKRNPQKIIEVLNSTIKMVAVNVEAEAGAGVGAEARVGEIFDRG